MNDDGETPTSKAYERYRLYFASGDGRSPSDERKRYDGLSVWQWLILNGALNRPTSTSADEDDEGADGQGGHVDHAIVKRDIRKEFGINYPNSPNWYPNHRLEILKWAKGAVAIHHTFLHVVLRGSVVMQRHRTCPRRRCRLPRLPRDELGRVGSFLGVEMGRRLRNVREFADALSAIIEGEADEEIQASGAMSYAL